MDLEKLIRVVKDKTPLWDTRDGRYHHRDVQKKLWSDVAKQIHADVDDVKKKWKGLRDVFRREFNKLTKSENEASDELNSSWHFFKHMTFLCDVMESRNPKGNLMSHQEEGTLAGCPEDSKIGESTSKSRPVESEPTSYSQQPLMNPTAESQQSKRKKVRRAIDEEFLLIEQQKLKIITEKKSNQDSDYLFLMSLHPYLQKVPPHRKLTVRHKLQQVFLDEEQHMSTSSTPSSIVCTQFPCSWVVKEEEDSTFVNDNTS